MMQRTQRPRAAAAFTLVEIMIAITIFASVLAAIYASWTTIVRGSKAALDTAASAQRARMALRALEDSISATQLFMQNAPYYAFLADTQDKFASLSFVSHLPASFPGSGMFGEMPVRRVTFAVENGSGGEPNLVLTQTPLLSVDAKKDSYSIILAREVSEFSMEFWDPRAGDWITEWTTTNMIPPAVRVYLAAGGGGQTRAKGEGVSVRTVVIPSIAVPPSYQLGGAVPARPQLPRNPPNNRSGRTGDE